MPITTRTKSWPDRARPKAAIAARSGISTVESGPEILCHRPARSEAVGRPAASRSAIERRSRTKSCSSASALARVNWAAVIAGPRSIVAARAAPPCEILLGGVGAGEGDRRGGDRRAEGDRRGAGDAAGVDVELAHVVEHQPSVDPAPGHGVDDPVQRAAGAVIDGDAVERDLA